MTSTITFDRLMASEVARVNTWLRTSASVHMNHNCYCFSCQSFAFRYSQMSYFSKTTPSQHTKFLQVNSRFGGFLFNCPYQNLAEGMR